MGTAFHQGLLDQALHLATIDKKRPNQANLRRSISASYYALFHYLIDEAINLMYHPKGESSLKYYLARTFRHNNMKEVAEKFSGRSTPGNLRQVFDSDTLNEKLRSVANAFIFLQDARIQADYNLMIDFKRQDAEDCYCTSKESFSNWKNIEDKIQSDTYLIGLYNFNIIKSNYRNIDRSNLFERPTD